MRTGPSGSLAVSPQAGAGSPTPTSATANPRPPPTGDHRGLRPACPGPCLTDPVQEPQVFPLRSCCQNKFPVTLGCLVKDYFPGPVTVTWDDASKNMSILDFPATNRTPGLLVSASQVTSSSKLPKQRFTCHVAHAASNTYVNKTFPGCLPANITRPTVRLLHSSCDPGRWHSDIQLYCLISGYALDGFGVTWLKDEKEIAGASTSTAPDRPEGKLFSTYRELNVSRADWESGSTFTCRVSSQGEDYKDSVQKCSEYEPRGVNAYLLPPSPLDLYVHNTPKLTCLVVDLENDHGVEVAWSRESGKPVKQASRNSRKHYNATTSVTATLPVFAKDWIDGETYRCTVTHPDLPKPIIRAIAKAPGKRAMPEVHVFPPPKEQGSQATLTLTCLVQNFFPADIAVQWLCNGKQISSSQNSSTTPPLRVSGPSPTFFVFSRLEISWAAWLQNDKFTCRVVHEALPTPRIVDKIVYKNPEVDLQELCVEEPESEDLDGLWTSTCVFITLFLLSVSYGATVTLFKVKWVFSALLQAAPEAPHDYANILQPAA